MSPSDQREEQAEREEARSGLRFVDQRVALAGGALTAAITFGTMYGLGSLGPLEAQGLLEGTLPTIRFLCSTVGTASATILALMLTLLSLSHTTDLQLKHVHYVRIRQISWMASGALVLSIGVLMLLVVPLSEAERFPTDLFGVVYYTFIGLSALLGGVMVSLVVMLLNAIYGVIDAIRPGVQSPVVATEEEGD